MSEESALRLEKVLTDVLEERDRQDSKWGEQNWPSVPLFKDGDVTCRHFEVPTESQAKWVCEGRHKDGTLTYADIALEEFCEAISAKDDKERRKELVQLAAVVVAWVECIDRRKANQIKCSCGVVLSAAPRQDPTKCIRCQGTRG